MLHQHKLSAQSFSWLGRKQTWSLCHADTMTQLESKFQTLTRASCFLTGTFYQLWHNSIRVHVLLKKPLSGLARNTDDWSTLCFTWKNSADRSLCSNQQSMTHTQRNWIQSHKATEIFPFQKSKILAFFLPSVCLFVAKFIYVGLIRQTWWGEKINLGANVNKCSGQTKVNLTWEANYFQLLE